MPAVQETVRTEVDALLELIKKQREISFEDACKVLSITIQTAEAWASFLEEEGLVAIKYKFTTPFFVYKEQTNKKMLSVSPFALLDEITSMINDLPNKIKKKEFEKARQTIEDIKEKISRLPVEFSTEHQALLSSINDIEHKMNTLIMDFIGKRANYDEKKEELEFLGSEFNKKLVSLKKLAMSTNIDIKGDGEIGKWVDEESFDNPLRKDINLLLLETKNILSKFIEFKETKEFDKAQEIYGELITKVRELTNSIEQDCGMDSSAKKKIEKSIDLTDKLMEQADAFFKAKDTPKYVEFVTKVVDIIKDILFLLKTVYDEKKLIEKKEIVRSEVENIEPLLKKIYEYIKAGKFDSAKELYQELEEKYVMLPMEFIEKKDTLKKDLIKLNRDLALSIAEKSRIEFDAKSKAINKMLKEAVGLLASTDNNHMQDASETYDRIEALYRQLPEGFIDEKTAIQHKVIELQEKLINKKRDVYFADLNVKTAKINQMLFQIKAAVNTGKIEEATSLYQKIREIFGMLPEGFIEEKTTMQNGILAAHHELLSLKTRIAVDEMNTKSSQINLMLMKANELVLKNDIVGASQIYDKIEDVYRSLPDGFLVKKTELQNRILKISAEIAGRLDKISSADMQIKIAKIKQQIKVVSDYLKKGEHDMALEEYEEIVNIYNQMPPGFIEQKTRVRAEILGLYRNILSSKDAFLIQNLDTVTKRKYDEILKLIMKIHQHIEAKEFSMMQTVYDRISELYNELPVGFVQKKSKIVDDIRIIYSKIRMYQTCLELQEFVRIRDFENLRKRLEYVYKVYNELIEKGFEDMQLFNFVYSRYFTYHRILLEERRIRKGILVRGPSVNLKAGKDKAIEVPEDITKKMPQGQGSEILGLRERLAKAESHVSDLNFEFVRPIDKPGKRKNIGL